MFPGSKFPLFTHKMVKGCHLPLDFSKRGKFSSFGKPVKTDKLAANYSHVLLKLTVLPFFTAFTNLRTVPARFVKFRVT